MFDPVPWLTCHGTSKPWHLLCPEGKDLIIPTQSLLVKPVMSFRLPWELLGPSWYTTSAMKNCGVSELEQWQEQLTGAIREVPSWSLLVSGQESHRSCWLCAMERELPASRSWIVRSLCRVAKLGIPEREYQSLLTLWLLLHSGKWVFRWNFSSVFWRGINKQDF